MNRMYAVILSSGTCVDFHFQHLIMEEMTWKCALSKNALCNSYTRCCLPVRGDHQQVLASGLSYIQVDKHGITILYQLYQCRPCTSRDISS